MRARQVHNVSWNFAARNAACERFEAPRRFNQTAAMSKGAFKNPLYLKALFEFRAHVHDPLPLRQDFFIANAYECFQGSVWIACQRFLGANFALEPGFLAHSLSID